MGRRGKTKEDVFNAGYECLKKGVNPTVVAVREILGGGSNSTINNHLKLFREENKKAIDGLGKSNDPLPDEHEEKYREIYNDMKVSIQNEYSNSVIEGLQDKLADKETEVEDLKLQVAELKAEVRSMKEMMKAYFEGKEMKDNSPAPTN